LLGGTSARVASVEAFCALVSEIESDYEALTGIRIADLLIRRRLEVPKADT
jgi:hypothetical protein